MTTEKIIDRIRKLLALADTGRGATEAEASLAAAKAAELMEEYGLSTMTVEMSGGKGEARASNKIGSTHEPWHLPLMVAIAESCFCFVDHERVGSYRKFEFRLIGRQSAVTTAGIMFDYLRKTIARLSREALVESAFRFRCGCTERIVERLQERHATTLRRQKQDADERAARQRASGETATANALVVTLVDYEQHERDLNEDYRMGLEPGTTARRRAAREAAAKAAEARLNALVAEGIPYGVAWNMVYLNHTRERAEQYEAQWTKDQDTKAKRSRRRKEWTQADERAWQSEQRRRERKTSSSWTAGRSAGDSVGLDPQVSKSSTRSLE